ncbi:MAG: amidase [Curvibacter lanceolatus]|jgi:Asp-tRNA(Asn)/Glu-tRNA(Gln) amidotransferase A subunit family amidase|uniref:amidase n=1 Tax=Curvibacter lanceolatus TaxID=86182 RepID=UPI002354307F|nr:amidase [Curvibacter lanceolatus]MBV5296407.1 amidase [Curvibacter lanceolatus]
MTRHIHPRASAVAVHAAITRRETTAEAVLQDSLERIANAEPALQAWKHLDAEAALRQARALDARMAAGSDLGLLGGVPLAVKDLIDTADMPTGYGAAVYEGHRPAADAEVVRRVRGADAVVVGKTVTTEYAYFTPGPTANPWDTTHTPGGSSSGSAAAVASGMVPLAFGSQTAGSLIRPASYCGVFALKPSHDLVSGAGVKAFAPSLDTVGWLANGAEDLELMRAALVGERFEPLPEAAGMRLLSCRTHEWACSDAGGEQVWERGHRLLSAAGVPVASLDLPASLAGLLQAQKTVMAKEAAQNLGREVMAYGPRVSQHIRDLVAVGQGVTDEAYAAAKALAAQAVLEVLALMGEADALLVPAAPGEAPPGLAATGDPVFSRVWTLLGLPCVNVPGLLGPGGLPVGLQLVGRPRAERKLLAVAQSLHRVITA